jgi:hypothetical protein
LVLRDIVTTESLKVDANTLGVAGDMGERRPPTQVLHGRLGHMTCRSQQCDLHQVARSTIIKV